MSRALRFCVVLAFCAPLVAIEPSRAAEPLLTITVDSKGDIVDVHDKDGALTAGPLQMPIARDDLQLGSMPSGDLQLGPMQSLSFPEVRMADGTRAFCRPCGGQSWCRRWMEEELRYFFGDRGQVIGIQVRVEEDKWVDLPLDFPDGYPTEPPQALGEILSLKTLTLVVLESGDGSRQGIVISGIQSSSGGVGGTEPLMWSKP